MDKLTALQCNQGAEQKYDVGDVRVMDYDLHDKETDKPLYCVIRRQDETLASSKNYKWIMDKKLYNVSELASILMIYHIYDQLKEMYHQLSIRSI